MRVPRHLGLENHVLTDPSPWLLPGARFKTRCFMPSAPFVGRRGAAALARTSSLLGVLISSSLMTVTAVAQTFPTPGPEGSVSPDLDLIAKQPAIAPTQLQ